MIFVVATSSLRRWYQGSNVPLQAAGGVRVEEVEGGRAGIASCLDVPPCNLEQRSNVYGCVSWLLIRKFTADRRLIRKCTVDRRLISKFTVDRRLIRKFTIDRRLIRKFTVDRRRIRKFTVDR